MCRDTKLAKTCTAVVDGCHQRPVLVLGAALKMCSHSRRVLLSSNCCQQQFSQQQFSQQHTNESWLQVSMLP